MEWEWGGVFSLVIKHNPLTLYHLGRKLGPRLAGTLFKQAVRWRIFINTPPPPPVSLMLKSWHSWNAGWEVNVGNRFLTPYTMPYIHVWTLPATVQLTSKRCPSLSQFRSHCRGHCSYPGHVFHVQVTESCHVESYIAVSCFLFSKDWIQTNIYQGWVQMSIGYSGTSLACLLLMLWFLLPGVLSHSLFFLG